MPKITTVLIILLTILGLVSCGRDRAAVDIPIALAQTIADKSNELRFCLTHQPHDLRTLLGAELIDLNNDGKPEIIVRTKTHSNCLCGNRSCAGWIYRETSVGYEQLLAANDDFHPTKTATNGYSDLIEEGKVYFDTRMRVLHTFDGHRYQPVKCWERKSFEWEYRSIPCPRLAVGRQMQPNHEIKSTAASVSLAVHSARSASAAAHLGR